ncbi:MAG: glycosyltransferase family 1 protein [Clostridiales bacterium]|nr:glycosyltransferase family 1 protein [Clostridiales bacterium]
MSEIRVLHVLHSMNCGGAETLIMNLYRCVDRTKIQFDFLVNVFDDMYYQKEIEELGGRIYRMKFLTSITPPVYERILYKFFISHPEYKIVHSHLETTTGIILKQAKKAGVPVRIAHSHTIRYTRTGAAAFIENAYKTHCRKKIVPNSTHRLACSEAAAKWLYGGADAVVMKNGINSADYDYSEETRKEVRDEFKINADTKLLMHVGRFCDPKNHSFLIDIFNEYHALNGNSMLMLVGEGELMEGIKKKVLDLNLTDSVIFTGIRNDVCRLLQAADYFVFPSLYEGLPLSLVEAQAADLPCFVSDRVPKDADLNISEYVSLPLGDSKNWAGRILEAGERQRRSRFTEICKAGFDIKSNADFLTDLYCKSTGM